MDKKIKFQDGTSMRQPLAILEKLAEDLVFINSGPFKPMIDFETRERMIIALETSEQLVNEMYDRNPNKD